MRLTQPKINDAHEFRPILSEIQDSPANPLARATFWLTFTTVLFFIIWSIVGQVDVVVSAPGKVIPEGHAKILQPLDSGIVSRLLVQEGDHVNKGQSLIEIDPSVTTDELLATQKNYQQTRLEMQRIHSALSGKGPGTFQNSTNEISFAQQQLYTASVNSLQRQQRSKAEELRRSEEEYKQTEAELAKNKALLGPALEKRERIKPVLDLIPRDEWDKNEADITTYTSNIDQQTHKLTELSHHQQQLTAELDKIQSDFEVTNLQDLSEKQKDATDLDSKVKELSFKRRKQTLVAPVSGYVDTMYVHTVGGVVSPAEKLLSIVPSDQKLLIQASVSNRDIGYIAKNMEAQLKIDTFDFQKYGMYQGRVSLIATDSHDSEAKQGSSATEQTEKKLEQDYEVFIEPTTKYLIVEGRKQPLAPGMTLTAEIKTGKRRIIEFLIYPLIKYWHDGITVR
jgi:hemolysin D